MGVFSPLRVSFRCLLASIVTVEKRELSFIVDHLMITCIVFLGLSLSFLHFLPQSSPPREIDNEVLVCFKK